MRRIRKLFVILSFFGATYHQLANRILVTGPGIGGRTTAAPTSTDEPADSAAPAFDGRISDSTSFAAEVERIGQVSNLYWWREYKEASARSAESIHRETQQALRIARYRNETAQRAADDVAREKLEAHAGALEAIASEPRPATPATSRSAGRNPGKAARAPDDQSAVYGRAPHPRRVAR